MAAPQLLGPDDKALRQQALVDNTCQKSPCASPRDTLRLGCISTIAAEGSALAPCRLRMPEPTKCQSSIHSRHGAPPHYFPTIEYTPGSHIQGGLSFSPGSLANTTFGNFSSTLHALSMGVHSESSKTHKHTRPILPRNMFFSWLHSM